MARISKTQTHAICWLNYKNFSNEKIASELGLNIEQVVKTLEKFAGVSEKNSLVTKTQPVNIISKTSGKGIDGVSIMTKEGSELGDQAKKTTMGVNKAIFRPKNG